MINNISNTIRIKAPAIHLFKSGDIITINIVKQLADGKWAVSINGRVFPALSDLKLAIGAHMRAQATISEGTLILKLINEESTPMQALILKLGVVNEPFSEMIVSVMMQSGIRISHEGFDRIRRLLQKMDKNDLRSARLLAHILSNDPQLNDAQIEALFSMLSFGDGQQREKQNNKKDKGNEFLPETLKKQIKEIATKEDDSGNLLQFYNHFPTNTEHWLVIPYSCGTNEGKIHGTIRIIYNSMLKKIEKMVLIAYDDNDIRFNFDCSLKKDFNYIKLFMSNPAYYKHLKKKIEELNVKLQNKGAKIDDIVYNERDFDGFSPVLNGVNYKAINTIT